MNLTVDGTNDKDIQVPAEEGHAPYWVFDIDKQENVAGPFDTKWQAKFKLLRILTEGKTT